MNLKKIISAVSAAAVAVVSAGVMAAFASAEENTPAGYVYFMADKTVIGQGFVTEPAKVPFYEGDKGVDIVNRAAEVLTEDSGYGAYITAFADEDNGNDVPAQIAEVCPDMSGRSSEGWLSAYDYTPESGWTYFINDEYAQVGIGDYEPADGDVLHFAFTVYGYGADLGVDNSSWGGAAALKDQIKSAELVRLLADNSAMLEEGDAAAYIYTAAMEALAQYEATQEDVDNAVSSMQNYISGAAQVTAEPTAEPTAEAATVESEQAVISEPDKGSPETGVEGVAVAFAVVILAGAGIALSRRAD